MELQHDRHYQALPEEPVEGVAGFDHLLVFAVAGLLCLGTVMVFSATVAADSDTLAFNVRALVRQLAHVGLGLVLLLGVMRLPLDWVQAGAKPVLLFMLLALALLFLPGAGKEVNGSMRWYNFGGVSIQPSEYMKVAAIIYFADYLARKKEDLHLFKVGVINVGAVVGVIGLLLLLQPDFGTTAVIVTTVVGMMFLAGIRFSHFLLSISVTGVLMTVLIWMAPYRLERLMSYRDPWADPYGSGFQLTQALIAIGRGEWFGTGLGSSIQKLFYLPHAGNDFLIAVIGEELGSVAIFTVIGLFALLLWRSFVIAGRAISLGHRFGAFLAQGVGLLLCIQASVHIGVNTGLLPTKGLTLPLMSYGGNSILATMLALGLLLGVDRQCRPVAGRSA